MRSTFWPNRICERQSCQNRHTGLKSSPKRGSSALFMKIVQIALFRSRTARFGEIIFFKGQTFQNRYTCPKFSSKRENSSPFIKSLPSVFFRSCAARLGQIPFLSVKVLKIVTRAYNSLQKGKTVRFPWKLYKTLVSGHAQEVLPKS